MGLVIQSNTLKGRLDVYSTKAASLEEQIQAEKDRTEEIDGLKSICRQMSMQKKSQERSSAL